MFIILSYNWTSSQLEIGFIFLANDNFLLWLSYEFTECSGVCIKCNETTRYEL